MTAAFAFVLIWLCVLLTICALWNLKLAVSLIHPNSGPINEAIFMGLLAGLCIMGAGWLLS